MTLRTTHTINEQELIASCIDGERIAQRQLYDKYIDFMMLTCLRYIPNAEDAREVMMDGFCNCFKNLQKFEYRGDGSLKAWMKKIMINQCLMFLRKKDNILAGANELDYASDVALDNDAIGRMSVKELMALIHSLPDGYRTIFNLYTFEGMTHKEIGVLMNISDNTSKSQLHKAKALLQKTILDHSKNN